MAEIKISELPDGGAIQQNDTVPIVRAGITVRATENPTVSVSAMAGNAGDIVSVNNSEDGFTLIPPPEPVIMVSQTWNRGGNTAANSMLRIGDSDGMALAYPVTLEDMAILRTDVDAATLEVLVDGSPVHELATSAVVTVENDIGVAIPSGSTLEIRNKAGGNTISNATVTLTFRRV